MIRSSFLLYSNLLILLFVGMQSQSFAQERNEELEYSISRPGLIAPNSSGLQLTSEEVLSQKVLIDFTTFPFTQLKDNPDQSAQLNEISCVRRYKITCLLRISLDGNLKIFLAEKNEQSWVTRLIPAGIIEKYTFANNFLSLTNSSDVTMAFNDEDERRIISWSIEGNKTPRSIPIKDNEFAILRNVYDSDKISGFALLSPNTPFVAATSAEKWLVLYKDGTFKKLKSNSECRPVTVLNDSIICVYWGDKNFPKELGAVRVWQEKYEDQKLIYIAPTQGNDIYTEVDGEYDSFHYIDGKLAFTLFENGWQRPYILDHDQSTVKPLIDSMCTLNQQHIYAKATTAKGDAMILEHYSPLQPSKLNIAKLDSSFNKACISNERVFNKRQNQFNANDFVMERITTEKRNVPMLFIESKVKGPLSGQLMIMVYGAYGKWLNEGYLGAWGNQWLAKGGSIAFVHVRSGGGYGPSWWRSGIRTTGKKEAAKDLIDTAFYLQNIDERFVGNTSIYAQSAGGILASSVALRAPKLIQNVILRAPCMSFSTGLRYECSGDNEFGDPLDPRDAEQMLTLSPRDIASETKIFPNFIFLIPEFDSLIDRENIIYGSEPIPEENKIFIDLKGVHHTDLLADEEEETLIARITTIIKDASN